MYLQLAGEEDKKMTDNWKGDADGILIVIVLTFTIVPLYVRYSRQAPAAHTRARTGTRIIHVPMLRVNFPNFPFSFSYRLIVCLTVSAVTRCVYLKARWYSPSMYYLHLSTLQRAPCAIPSSRPFLPSFLSLPSYLFRVLHFRSPAQPIRSL